MKKEDDLADLKRTISEMGGVKKWENARDDAFGAELKAKLYRTLKLYVDGANAVRQSVEIELPDAGDQEARLAALRFAEGMETQAFTLLFHPSATKLVATSQEDLLREFKSGLPPYPKVATIIYRVFGKSDTPVSATDNATFFPARNLPGLYFSIPNNPGVGSPHLVGRSFLPSQA